MKDYKKILEGVVSIISAAEKSDIGFANICTYIGENCPELQESEDERIRKELIDYIYRLTVTHNNIDKYNTWIEWLEKQGEQKPFNKVEPKFKVKYANSEYNVHEIKEIAGVTYYGIEDEPNHIDYILPDNCEIVSGYGVKEKGSPYPTKSSIFSNNK